MRRLAELWRAGLTLHGWPIRLALAAVLALGIVFIGMMAARLGGPIRSGNVVFSDFFAHWSYGGFALAHPGPAIYDHDAMFAFQRGLFDGRLKALPYAYPPPYLFLVAPFALFDIWTGALLWSALSVAAFTIAVNAGRWQPWPTVLCILAPSTTICLGYGQNGLFIAALLVGGLRLLPGHPGWAGALLALACIKPQMAVLVPVALLAGRQWRTIAAGVATGTALILASSLWIGPIAWIGWLEALQGQGAYAAEWIGAHRQPTLTATLSLLGVDRASGLVAQAILSALIALGVAAAWWRETSEAARCTLLAGVLLATPYGFVYDLPLITAALLGLVAGRQALSWPETAIAGAVLLLPMVLHTTSRFFWTGPLVMAALFVLCAGKSLLFCEQKRSKKNFVRLPGETP